MEIIEIDKPSQLRCVCCGKRILAGVKGQRTEEIKCRCGTSYQVDMSRIDLSIQYDTSEYEELER